MKFYCPRGHFDTYSYSKNGRLYFRCRECTKERQRQRSEIQRRSKRIPERIFGDPVRRFWTKVDKSRDCWTWTGYRNFEGYGTFAVVPGIVVYAHRFSFEIEGGEISEGYQLHHECENPSCVNPAHLRPVTPSQHSKLHNRR